MVKKIIFHVVSFNFYFFRVHFLFKKIVLCYFYLGSARDRLKKYYFMSYNFYLDPIRVLLKKKIVSCH